MRYLPLIFIASCYAYVYPDYQGGGSRDNYSQTDDGEDDPHCERPPAPSGPKAKAQLCQACKTSADCDGEGSLCLANGMCGKACKVDCDCPHTYECRGAEHQASRQCVPASGMCPKPPECTKDSECSGNRICVAEKCVDKCANDAACGEGKRCFEDGHCGVACCFNTDCAAEQACTNGRCEASGPSGPT